MRLQDADGQLQSSRVIADCDFRTLKSRLNSELQSALERNPDLLKTPTLSGLDEGCSARTQVRRTCRGCMADLQLPRLQMCRQHCDQSISASSERLFCRHGWTALTVLWTTQPTKSWMKTLTTRTVKHIDSAAARSRTAGSARLCLSQNSCSALLLPSLRSPTTTSR